MDKIRNSMQPDELFRRKLKDYEEPVGEEVWNRISRKTTPASKPIWRNRRVVAAAVVAGLLIGSGVWIVRGWNNDGEMTASSELDEEVKHDFAPLTDVSGEGLSVRKEADVEFGEPVAVIPSQKESLNDDGVAVSLGAARVRESPEVQEKPVPGLNRDGDLVENSQPELAELPKSEAEQPRQSQVETRVLVVYVTPPSHLSAPEQYGSVEERVVAQLDDKKEEKGRKGFNRFFKQLKNVKTGEKVDWDELGFTPQRRFANVEYRYEE